MKQLFTFIAGHDGDDVRAFLDAFLNASDAPRDGLVRGLAEHPWRDVFEYLAGHPGIPDEETRLRLFDTALLSALRADSYEIGEFSRRLLQEYCPWLTAISEPQDHVRTDRVFSVLEAADLIVTDLGCLGKPLRDLVVAAHRYEISTSNLRLALGIDGHPTLDEVRRVPSVWAFCKASISRYTAAAQADEAISDIILTATALVGVINDQYEEWSDAQLREVMAGSANSAMIEVITDVPETVWPMIVEVGRMATTVANVNVYAQKFGVDESLSALLTPGGDDWVVFRDVDQVDVETREALAILVLNATAGLAAKRRVHLAQELDIETEIDPTEVTPQPDQLLARALEANLLPDNFGTFAHFARGGWRAVSEAFAVSENISEFITPALLEGFVAEFLEDPNSPDDLRRLVVEDIARYIANDDAGALRAASIYACDNRIWLPLDDVRNIARVSKSSDAVLVQLVRARETSPTDLSAILASLGEPYAQLNGGLGAEFDLPAGSSNATLFKRLEIAGLVKIVQKVVGRGRKVKNLV